MNKTVTVTTAAPQIETNAADADERMVGEGVGFERIRRITGYLVGTLDHFNNAKRAEESMRVKHSIEMTRI